MKKAVIFDMDGVIFDSEKLWEKAFHIATKKFNLDLDENYRHSIAGKQDKIIRAELKEIYPSQLVDDFRDFIQGWVSEQSLLQGAPLKKGFCELIEYLKQNNFAIGLATSSFREKAENFFAKHNLQIDNIFDATIFGNEIENGKPNPDIFLAIAERLHTRPQNCYVVEDSYNGIQASYAGNFNTIMVIDLLPPTEVCRKICTAIFNDLTEFQEFLHNQASI